MVKKNLIMEKALELFAENGFTATSIQQITDSCGISKGAFYLYFKSKDELISGLIDYFMTELITNIEQAVSKEIPAEHLLYNYYHTSFYTFQKHSGFTKIFLKEQMAGINIELLDQMKRYNTFSNTILESIVDLQFPSLEQKMRADLIYVIKGFVKHYMEMFLISSYPVNLETLSRSLVEKTTIIAKYAKVPFIAPEYLSFPNDCTLPTKEQLADMLTQSSREVTDEICLQSIDLLKSELIDPNLPPAVIQGLLKNLRAEPNCKWVAFLYGLSLKTTAN